jgi:Ring finger domain
MAKPASNPEPSIPSVFVSQKSGMLLQKLYAPGYTQVYISAMSDMVWMSMIISTLAGFFAVSVVVTAFYLARRPVAGMGGEDHDEGAAAGGGGGGASNTRRRRPAMNVEQLRLLPVIVHQAEDATSGNEESSPVSNSAASTTAATTTAEPAGEWHTAGDTKRVCAICLELYEPNDKLRLLPCQHRYHKECVDQWLTTRTPLCPICKHDASTGIATATTTSLSTQLEGADLEAGEGASGSSRRGLFSEDGARENVRRAAQRVLNSRLLSWARSGHNSGGGGGGGGSNSYGNSSGSGGAESSGEEAQLRLLPLADSSQRIGDSIVVQGAQQEPVSSSSANV